VDAAERGPAGELALKIADQGWAGLLPILAHDATHVRLKPEKAEQVAEGRGKAPGSLARAGCAADLWERFASEQTKRIALGIAAIMPGRGQ